MEMELEMEMELVVEMVMATALSTFSVQILVVRSQTIILTTNLTPVMVVKAVALLTLW